MRALIGAGLGVSLALVPAAATAAHIRGTSGSDTLVGTPGKDWIEALDGDDQVYGRDGNDLLTGGRRDDLIRGGPGMDEIEDDRGRDELRGGAGRDSLDGRRGVDLVVGGPGNDYLADYYGGDTLDAGAGDDRSTVASRSRTRPYPPTHLALGTGDDEVLLDPDGRRDVIDCGPGDDLVEFIDTLDEQDELLSCETVQEYLGP